MIPIGDDNSDRVRFPIVNIIILLLNVLVYIFLQQLGTNSVFLMRFSLIPAEIITGADYIAPEAPYPSPYPVYLTLISSMFMHGSVSHIFGNMLYLWVFGDNLENRMGHLRYLIFYLLCGIIASLCHVLACYISREGLFIPSIGASGAISAILGGYLILFPKNPIRILVFFWVIRIPAFLTLGLWIAFQLYNSYSQMGMGEGGIAYAAHIGGFFAGMLLVRRFAGKNMKELQQDEPRYNNRF